MKLINFFPAKKLTMKNGKIFPKKFLKTVTVTETCQKVGTGTGTVKNSYGSATLSISAVDADPVDPK
jgi:hypothetical protein